VAGMLCPDEKAGDCGLKAPRTDVLGRKTSLLCGHGLHSSGCLHLLHHHAPARRSVGKHDGLLLQLSMQLTQSLCTVGLRCSVKLCSGVVATDITKHRRYIFTDRLLALLN